MNDNDKLKYLTGLLGEEKAKEFFDKAGLKQKALREVGVEEKEAKPATETAPEAPATAPEVPGVDLEVIFKALSERLDIPGLQQFVTDAKASMDKIDILESVIKEKSESADDALAQKIAAPILNKMAWSRPSQSKENVADEKVEDDKALIKSKPEFWLSEVTNTSPLEV